MFQRFVQHFCWTFLFFFCCWTFTWGLVFWTWRWEESITGLMDDEKHFLHSQFPLEHPSYSPSFTFPLVSCWTQNAWTRVGHQYGALSGKRGVLVQCKMKMTFLWMSDPLSFQNSFHRSIYLCCPFLYRFPERTFHASTAIGLWKHRIPSDLRS